MKPIRLSLIQYPLFSDPWDTWIEVLLLLKKAAKKKPDVIVLPEMWLGSPKVKSDCKTWSEFYSWVLQEMQVWAQEHRIGLVFSQLESAEKKFFNTAYIINTQGRILASYRKIHLFSHGGEHRVYTSGQKPVVVQTPWGRVGLAICYDIRFPELIRKLAVMGAEILIVPAQWPESRREHWLTLLKARAIENQFFVVGVNRLGKKEKNRYSGDSVAVDPWGDNLLHLKKSQNINATTIHLEKMKKIRETYPFFKERK